MVVNSFLYSVTPGVICSHHDTFHNIMPDRGVLILFRIFKIIECSKVPQLPQVFCDNLSDITVVLCVSFVKAAISSFWLVAPPEVLEVFNVYASVVKTHLRYRQLRIHVYLLMS